MRLVLKILLALIVIGLLAYYPLVLHSPSPGKSPYPLDIVKVRELAQSLPGPAPYEIRMEKVAEFVFAEAMVMAGEPWQSTPIPIYSYQLVIPGGSIIADAAVSGTEGVPGFMVNDFDTAAYERMNAAMEKADHIVITHEHFDHIAGIFDHPNLEQILPAVKITQTQIDHPERMKPSEIPPAFDGYQPLQYQDMHALAPGVVLIQAPGHTPGSQMVYVRLSDGKEVLLLGDVAWQYRNIEAVKARPLFSAAMIRENRTQTIEQFDTLHQLAETHPEIKQVPGHDEEVMAELLDTGVLMQGFQ